MTLDLLTSFEYEEPSKIQIEQLHYANVRIEQLKKRICFAIETNSQDDQKESLWRKNYISETNFIINSDESK